MRAAGPAAGPPHTFLQLRADPLHVLSAGLRLLDREGPADPLVARERRDVLPLEPRRGVGQQGFAQVRRHRVDYAAGEPGCHATTVHRRPAGCSADLSDASPFCRPACRLAGGDSVAMDRKGEQSVGDVIGGVAQYIAFGGEVAGDALDAEGLDALDVGNGGFGAFSGVTLAYFFGNGAVLTMA